MKIKVLCEQSSDQLHEFFMLSRSGINQLLEIPSNQGKGKGKLTKLKQVNIIDRSKLYIIFKCLLGIHIYINECFNIISLLHLQSFIDAGL